MALRILISILMVVSTAHIAISEVIQGRGIRASNTTNSTNSTSDSVYDCELYGNVSIPEVSLPGAPQNVRVVDNTTGIHISWDPPLENAELVQSYTIKYRNDSTWKVLNTIPLTSSNTTFVVTDLVWGRTYYVRILANLENGCVSSEEVSFTVRLTAIIGVVVACILLVMVIIILGIYVVKMYNKSRRRRISTNLATARHRPAGRQVPQ
ncbi:protein turtle [Anabrus simplex]|uniref:protein turtle n=1 Tax=Anabrus simplex TaxID=316456 RepID=UPI0035A2CDF4